MTVLIGVAVKSSDKEIKPYLLMGSDSLLVKYNMHLDGKFTMISSEEGYEKIFEVNNKLIAMSGMYHEDLTQNFLGFIRNNNDDIEELTKKCFKYIKNNIINSGSDVARCKVILGSCDNSNPKISYIEVDNQDIKNAKYEIAVTQENNFSTVFSGVTDNTEDLQEKFVKRVNDNNPNLNSSAMKKAAEDYLKNAAKRHADTCNEDIKFVILK